MSLWKESVKHNECFIAWGFGDYFLGIIFKLPHTIKINYVCDNDSQKWGKKVYIDKNYIECISPEQLAQKFTNPIVLICTQSEPVATSISTELDLMGIRHLHINEVLKDTIIEWEKEQIEKYDQKMTDVVEPPNVDIITNFISVSVPIEYCNLKCSYCYVGQQNSFGEKNVIYHSPEFIRRSLSRKRLGGTAFINFCGSGETLLCKELIGIIKNLLEEGHYISIITNALLSQRIKEILNLGHTDRLFFKCSFHYMELKKRNLLNAYIENVKLMQEKGASISVELVPHDELIPHIDEIKAISLKHFGAMPHVTVARDERLPHMPILSKYSETEYYNIWKQFDSKMFDYKFQKREKQKEYCIAGRGTFILNLDYGGTSYCPKNPSYINIYKNIWEKIEYTEIGNNCQSPYCINAHAYLTLGMVEACNEYSYLDIRDRSCLDGTHWIKEKMAHIMRQRICDNLKGKI